MPQKSRNPSHHVTIIPSVKVRGDPAVVRGGRKVTLWFLSAETSAGCCEAEPLLVASVTGGNGKATKNVTLI